MNVEIARNEKGLLEARCPSNEWEDLERLVRYVKEKFAGTVVYKAEGPDARTWDLTVGQRKIVFQQLDTGGVWFFSESPEGENTVMQIAEQLKSLTWDMLPKARGFPFSLWN